MWRRRFRMSAGSPILDSSRWVRLGQPGQTFEHRPQSLKDPWPTGLPDHCSRIVALRALPPRKTPEDCQGYSRIVQAGRAGGLHYRAQDEVCLGLTVLKEMPRHSGYRLIAKKEARPRQGNGTGLEKPPVWEVGASGYASKKECDFVERLLVSPDTGAVHLARVKGDLTAAAAAFGAMRTPSVVQALPYRPGSLFWMRASEYRRRQACLGRHD